MELPEWTDIVKTARFKELAPYDPDWYYVRAGKIYFSNKFALWMCLKLHDTANEIFLHCFVACNFSMTVFVVNFDFSFHGKEDLLERWSWCRCISEDLWWEPKEWKSPTSFLQEQWFNCSPHSSTVAEHGHHWDGHQRVNNLFYPWQIYLSSYTIQIAYS